jgi:hypothetical protein
VMIQERERKREDSGICSLALVELAHCTEAKYVFGGKSSREILYALPEACADDKIAVPFTHPVTVTS